MTVLLDTHAFVWAVTDPDKLSSTARDVIADASTPLRVSAVTAWEIGLKHRSGRWPEAGVLVRQYSALLQRLGATELPLTSAHALTAGGMDWSHADPIDRALVAQAIGEGLPLVSRDAAFRGVPGLTVLW